LREKERESLMVPELCQISSFEKVDEPGRSEDTGQRSREGKRTRWRG